MASTSKTTPAKALKFLKRLLTARSLLSMHGLLTDAERKRVNGRIEQWVRHGGKP